VISKGKVAATYVFSEASINLNPIVFLLCQIFRIWKRPRTSCAAETYAIKWPFASIKAMGILPSRFGTPRILCSIQILWREMKSFTIAAHIM
jgi:hypothetical protein